MTHTVDSQILVAFSDYTLKRELIRTAEHINTIAKEQGIYFAIAFLSDANYDNERLQKLLPILHTIRGAIKNELATNRNCT